MTQDPNAKARPTLADILKLPDMNRHAKPDDPSLADVFEQRFQAALTEARAEALEEAAKVAEYWCDEGYHGEHCANDCSAARIRALKEKA